MAEDNRADELLIQEALQQLPVRLQVNHDGEQMLFLLEQIEAGRVPVPDLILLDLNLPRRNGLEVLARLRSSQVCGPIPVVIVTSSDAARDRQATAAFDVAAYFRKPSDFDEFMQLGELVKKVIGWAP